MSKRAMRVLEFTLALCGALLFMSRPAHAYVDAGSGSYFLQMAIGILAGAAFSLKLFWANIRRFFSSKGRSGGGGKGPTDNLPQ